MARVSPLNSDAVIEIADELVERYEAQGWTVEKPAAKRASKSKNDDK